MSDPTRGTGRTTRQMREAPNGAVFVWCNDRVDYARYLARDIGRRDLEVIAPTHIEARLRGRTVSAVVLDHALERLTAPQHEAILMARRHSAGAPQQSGDTMQSGADA